MLSRFSDDVERPERRRDQGVDDAQAVQIVGPRLDPSAPSITMAGRPQSPQRSLGVGESTAASKKRPREFDRDGDA